MNNERSPRPPVPAGTAYDAAAGVGILMLDTVFPRIPGDVGNPSTWPFPVMYRIVAGASADRAVRGDANQLLQDFIAAGLDLVANGVAGITTSCGFLSLLQRELAASLPVPVAASALMQVPMIEKMLAPGRRCGILTIAASSLTDAHLEAVGVRTDTPIGTTEHGVEFTRAILGNEAMFDIELARADHVEAARALINTNPETGAIVLECTNMAPYAHDIATATGLPVYSIETFVRWFQSGLQPRRFTR